MLRCCQLCPSYNQKKIQIQNKQTIAQKQAQNHIDLILRGFLYYLETIAHREGQFKRKFDNFNPNSIQGKENMNKLINHLRVKSRLFIYYMKNIVKNTEIICLIWAIEIINIKVYYLLERFCSF